MIRIGQVKEIDSDARTVRVSFPEDDLVSDWLKVISTPPTVAYEENDCIVTSWMPKLGATVICLYHDEPNGEGYVLGGTE